MRFWIGLCLVLTVSLGMTWAQRGNFRQFNNNDNRFNNQNNFRRPNNNNNNRFRPVNNNFNRPRQFNNNFRQQPQQQQRRPPQQQQQPRASTQTNSNFAFGLDTSDGRFAKFNGPVKGLPHGHGGGKYGAADCLLCPNGF